MALPSQDLEPPTNPERFTFGQGDDGDAREFEMLVEGRHIGLIAADPVQRLGQQDIERAMPRFVHKPLDARPLDRART